MNIHDSFSELINIYLNQIKYDSPDRKHLHDSILMNLVNKRTEIMSTKPLRTVNTGIQQIQLEKKAEEVASWNNSYDKLIWFWAETTLFLELGFNPPHEKIVELAEDFATKEKNIQKIHWYLAENLLKIGLS